MDKEIYCSRCKRMLYISAYSKNMSGKYLKTCVECCNKRKKNIGICQHQICIKYATFNFADESIGLYCKNHKLPNMMDVKNRICKHSGCKKQPHFKLLK